MSVPRGLIWRKAEASIQGGHCVQVAGLPDGDVFVRHSRDPAGPSLRFTRAEWAAFVDGVKKNEFDSPGTPLAAAPRAPR